MLNEALAVHRELVDIAWVAFEANPLGVGFGRGFGLTNSMTRLRLVDSLRRLMILLKRTGATSELAAVEDELARVS